MGSGAKFTKILVIQSLEPNEPKTGQHLVEYINGLEGSGNSAELIDCESAIEFLEYLHQLEEEIIGGEIPLLHVECHGHREDGLEFANGSTLSWPELVVQLRRINSLTRFNLIAVFSACFGGYLLSGTGAIEPSPFWAFVAPTETVDAGEIMGGLRLFYSTLFQEQDVGKAVIALRREKLSRGSWVGEPAELWFLRVVIGYVKTYCNEQATLCRTRIMYRTLKSQGERASIGKLKRVLKQTNRENIPVYFSTFFMVQEVPENEQRFSMAKIELESRLSRLRSTGTYFI